MLEREHELAELAAAAQEAAADDGSVVLVSGEAGIGKSVLVEAVRSVLPADGRLLVGYCDDLATRRALGPFRDLAGSVGTDLTRALQEGGDRNQLLDALLPLARLSPEAVRQSSAASALDSRHVYAVTSGNPFFVTEVIAAGDTSHPPPTVVDAVLARIRTTDPATQDALEQLAVVPSALDRWMVDRLVPGGVPALATNIALEFFAPPAG
jgi:hypothetical protein